jgi:fucose permease
MAAAPPSTVAHRRLFVACSAAMVVFAAAVTVPCVCLPQLGDEFGLSLAARGMLGGLRMAALLGALLICGYLADRFGKALFLTTGMLLAACGLTATALAPSYHLLIGAQLIVGTGVGTLESLLNPLVADLSPRDPARALNLVNGLFSVGLVAAALVSGEMLQAHFRWRDTLWPWVPAALVVAVLFMTRRYPHVAHDAAQATSRAFLGRPLFWLLMVAILLGGGCESGLTNWGSSFMEQELGASARAGALSVAFFGAFMALGRFGSGAIVPRVGSVGLMLVSTALCALATGALCLVRTVQGAWALFALGGLSVACLWPTILAVAAQEVQAGSATMFAALAASGVVGCMIFPWGIGIVGDVAGLRAGSALLPAGMVAEFVVLLVVWRMTARTQEGRPS